MSSILPLTCASIFLEAHFCDEILLVKFTITAEILPHSLANFYCQNADRHMSL